MKFLRLQDGHKQKIKNPRSKLMYRFNLYGICVSLLFFTLTSTTHSREIQLDLDKAIELALQNNQSRVVSQEQLAVAEAQYKQALSTFWPSIDFNASWQRRDEDPTFTLDGLSVTTVTPLGPLTIDVPETEKELFDRDVTIYSIEATYPLFTGGKLSAIRQQAKLGTSIAQETVRRNDLQIINDVKRYYAAAMMTSQLHSVSEEISIALEVARDITKQFFESGSNSVDRLDYLKSEMAVSAVDNMRIGFDSNHQAALAALSFSMGLDWNDELILNENHFPKVQMDNSLANLINQAKHANPTINTLTLSVQAADERIKEARSAYYPTFALRGESTHIKNSFDSGLTNRQNDDSWTIGVYMKMPLFNGFRTQHKVAQAKHEKNSVNAQRILVDQGIATSIRKHLIDFNRAQKLIEISNSNVKNAIEHSELTDSA